MCVSPLRIILVHCSLSQHQNQGTTRRQERQQRMPSNRLWSCPHLRQVNFRLLLLQEMKAFTKWSKAWENWSTSREILQFGPYLLKRLHIPHGSLYSCQRTHVHAETGANLQKNYCSDMYLWRCGQIFLSLQHLILLSLFLPYWAITRWHLRLTWGHCETGPHGDVFLDSFPHLRRLYTCLTCIFCCWTLLPH